MERNASYALERTRTNATTTWINPDSGNEGAVTPTRTYLKSDGEPCREYLQTVRIGGDERTAYGTACRQPDGSWKIQS
jgi:surface antigen